ncbi:hypothetical protein MNBD_GAMMA26-1040 [hydrothermal vent metagenome]|uniref:Uncharacterized protein n=1 Tax=hydrothermal vent metagenome TaxID=652676 RepID=A0A3B1AY77_9ZZZZ
MVHSARAQADIYAFLTAKENSSPYLQVALNNLYFKPYAERLAMRSLLHANIQAKNPEKVRYFAQWAEQQIAINPRLKMFEDLINAYTFLDLEKERCRIIHTGITMHPTNEPLRAAAAPCNK